MAEEQKVASEQTKPDAPQEKQGLTARLFPETVQPEAVVEAQPEAKAEEKAEEKKEAPSPVEPTAEEFDLEDILAKQGIPLDKVKSKIKVDGKEEVVSFSELKKRVQLKEHLDQAGQELGRQRQELKQLRKGVEQERPQISQVPAQADLGQNDAPSQSDPYTQQLERRLQQMEAQTAALSPVIYDVNRQEVAKELKAEGYDDFLDYLPKMEAYLATVKDPARLDYYDQKDGAKELFRQLKLKDLTEQMREKQNAPATKPTLERPRPPIQKIDGGSQPSTLGTVDDWTAKDTELRNKWVKTKDLRDYSALMRHRGAMSS